MEGSRIPPSLILSESEYLNMQMAWLLHTVKNFAATGTVHGLFDSASSHTG